MHSTETILEPWSSFLHDLDQLVEEEVALHCLGGFVVTQKWGFARRTLDLDVISLVPRDVGLRLIEEGGKGSSLHRKHGVYLDRVGVASVPEDYDERLTALYPGAFAHIQLFAVDPYDIALSKLERNTEKDREDVFYLARVVPFDLNILRERYQKEMRYQMGNPDREDQTLRLWTEAIEEERARTDL